MKKKEIVGMLALLQTEYPQSFGKLTAQQIDAKANLWADMLADYDGRIVMGAVKTLLAEDREFAPSIGQIQTRVKEIMSNEELSEGEAWARVSKACSNGLYGYKEEYAKLPLEVQKAVGCAEQLRAWAMIDIDEFQTVVASNFMRSYKVTKKREEFMQALPEEVKRLLTEATQRMALTDGN